MGFFAGIDWALEEHAICVIDESGRVHSRFQAAHSASGLAEMFTKLRRLAAPTALPIAIERPTGALVDALVQAGHPVVPIHPNAVKAARPRYAAAAGKSDPGDAYLLADLLRTDGHRLHALRPLSDESRALRALVRGRDDLVAHRTALANQLRALLESFWAGAAVIFRDVDSPIALAFLAQFPTPAHASKLGSKRLARFLTRNAYCGRRAPEDLLRRLRSAVVTDTGELEMEAKGDIVRSLVATLETVVIQLQKLTAAVEHAVTEHSDGPMITSFPRIGRVNAGQILAEIGDDRARFSSDDHLAAEAGVAPVTHQSGKHRGVVFRWACNKRLRQALICWADNSRRASPWANGVYEAARARGCDHPHAVRILARAWLRILWRCWMDRAPYDRELHNGARRLAMPA
jgi:transposase